MARRLPPLLPDAWAGPLARDRHLPKALRHRDDLTFKEVEPAIRQEAGAALTFKSCGWFSTYRIYHRAAERFRSGRCFLLGDAAHVHSPMGGQGMNTGLQDAYNLAWKLALVVAGHADPMLLDSYQEERLPVAKLLLETTDRAFQLVVSDNWLASVFRTRVIARLVARAMTVGRVRKLAFRTLSQTGVAYPKSALSQLVGHMPKGAPASGERFPWLKLRFAANSPVEDLYQKLDDTRFNLLASGQAPDAVAIPAELRDLLAVQLIPSDPQNDAELARARIPQPSFYLLRPDGHVGLCGAELRITDLVRYLRERAALNIPRERTTSDPGPTRAPVEV